MQKYQQHQFLFKYVVLIFTVSNSENLPFIVNCEIVKTIYLLNAFLFFFLEANPHTYAKYIKAAFVITLATNCDFCWNVYMFTLLKLC